MLARVYTCAVIGLEGVIVEVEVDTAPGLPSMIIVGLPDAASRPTSCAWSRKPWPCGMQIQRTAARENLGV